MDVQEAQLRRAIQEAFARQRAGHEAEAEQADRLHLVEPTNDEPDRADER